MTSRPKDGEATKRAAIRDRIHQFAKDNRLTMRCEKFGAEYMMMQLDLNHEVESSLKQCFNLMLRRKTND